MARASATSCCKYFLYRSADETRTTITEPIAIPTYLKIFATTRRTLDESSERYVPPATFVPPVHLPGPARCASQREFRKGNEQLDG